MLRMRVSLTLLGGGGVGVSDINDTFLWVAFRLDPIEYLGLLASILFNCLLFMKM